MDGRQFTSETMGEAQARRETIREFHDPITGGIEITREIVTEPLTPIPAELPADVGAMLAIMERALPSHAREHWHELKRERIARTNAEREREIADALARGRTEALAARSRSAPGTVLGEAPEDPTIGRSLRSHPGARHGDAAGSRRLGRVSVPGAVRRRAIVQIPAEDAASMGGNSLIYGHCLRTLMSVGGATRRAALGSIARGLVNPHDPIDVARWSASRAGMSDAVAALDALAAQARRNRANINREGVDVRAASVTLEPYAEPSADGAGGVALWAALAELGDALESLAPVHRAELAGMLAAGDVGAVRAWCEHHYRRACASEAIDDCAANV